MKNRGFRMFLILALVLTTGPALAGYGDPMPMHPTGNVSRSGTLSDGADAGYFTLSCLCPDIAIMEPFRSGGLDYVHTMEFAESVFAVASGTSRYSPETLPPEWMATAYGWWTHVAEKETATIRISSAADTFSLTGKPGPGATVRRDVRLLSPVGGEIDLRQGGLDGDSCSPLLLFRASLEYRWRTANPDAELVYPYKVRKATLSLGDAIQAKLEMAERFARRADEITDMISRAERLGAATCQPKELSTAKSELAQARQMVTDIHVSIRDTDASFAKAEMAIGSILSLQRFASSRGLCYSR